MATLKVNTLLRKHLGKEAADRLIKKIGRMAKAKASPEAIQLAVCHDLDQQCVKIKEQISEATGIKAAAIVMVPVARK